jgi:glycine/D-amino acid oxidase-like deaminating enzyme
MGNHTNCSARIGGLTGRSAPQLRQAAGVQHRGLGVHTIPLWIDGAEDRAPAPAPALDGEHACDLAVVGGGFIGLWTALLAKERDADRHVVIVERGAVGQGAAGRNGGMLMTQLLAEPALFAGEERTIVELQYTNHAAFEDTLARHGIACDLEHGVGELMIATAPWQVAPLHAQARAALAQGKRDVRVLDGFETRALIDSPRVLAGILLPHEASLLDPGKLVRGLRVACENSGVEIYEGTPVTALKDAGTRVAMLTPAGRLVARHVALATYAHRSLLGSVNRRRVPTYSHVVATEPLSATQLGSLGWEGRQAVVSADPLFDYYRLTADNRIVWGWVDGGVPVGLQPNPERDADPAVFSRIAATMHATFPQLGAIQVTHKWCGALDVSSRRAPFYTLAQGGRVVSANGFTTGVAGSRFSATVMLDLLAGAATPLTQLALVRNRPRTRRYPPAAVLPTAARAVTRSLVTSTQTGRRTVLLRTINRLGYIF